MHHPIKFFGNPAGKNIVAIMVYGPKGRPQAAMQVGFLYRSEVYHFLRNLRKARVIVKERNFNLPSLVYGKFSLRWLACQNIRVSIIHSTTKFVRNYHLNKVC